MVNIIRILLTKLRASNTRDPYQCRLELNISLSIYADIVVPWVLWVPWVPRITGKGIAVAYQIYIHILNTFSTLNRKTVKATLILIPLWGSLSKITDQIHRMSPNRNLPIKKDLHGYLINIFNYTKFASSLEEACANEVCNKKKEEDPMRRESGMSCLCQRFLLPQRENEVKPKTSRQNSLFKLKAFSNLKKPKKKKVFEV
ncbi:hypothetical protein Avbf_12584 [Armadillidium vulgare]|nr:hypothetical protein Avbf_12584 [Armadillidium vulgare]